MKRIYFKNIPQNKRLIGIGDLFCLDKSEDFWRVPALFKADDGSTERVALDIETLCLLGLGRKFHFDNASAPFTKMNYAKTIKIPPKKNWENSWLGKFPRLAKQVAEDSEVTRQCCFVFEYNGTTFWLPNFEFARKLFFHAGFLARAAVVPNGLDMLFHVGLGDDQHDVSISTVSKTGVPAAYFRRLEYRQFFAWLLLNQDIRTSFESISGCRNDSMRMEGGYLKWDLYCRPPLDLPELNAVVRGPYFPDIKQMLIWEIDSIWNLPNPSRGRVLFMHPDIRKAGKTRGNPPPG